MEPRTRSAMAGLGRKRIQPARSGYRTLQRDWPGTLPADPRGLWPTDQSLQRGGTLRAPQFPQAE